MTHATHIYPMSILSNAPLEILKKGLIKTMQSLSLSLSLF